MKHRMYSMLIIIINMGIASLAIAVVTTVDTLQKLTDERDKAAETNRLLKTTLTERVTRAPQKKDKERKKATQVIKVTDIDAAGRSVRKVPIKLVVPAGKVEVREGLDTVIERQDPLDSKPYRTRLKEALEFYILSIDNALYQKALQMVSEYASIYVESKKQYDTLLSEYTWTQEYGSAVDKRTEKQAFNQGAQEALQIAENMYGKINEAISILTGLHDATDDNVSDMQDAWKNNVSRYIVELENVAAEVEIYKTGILGVLKE